MLILYPYKLGSRSAKNLREALQVELEERVKMVRPNGRYRPRQTHVIINWGATTIPNWNAPMLNTPEAVRRASNKITAFQAFHTHNVPCVEWTTDKAVAQNWIDNDYNVVARGSITGHGGAGITMHGPDFTEPLPNVRLYTKYKKKKFEYRVHVVKGAVIDVVQKKKRRADARTDNFNTLIRNIGHDWIFARTNITITEALKETAIRAVAALGLDFGAVDVIYNARDDRYYALEVNTAPGIVGTTVDKYVEALVNG